MQQKVKEREREINIDCEAKKLSEEFLVYAVFHPVLKIERTNIVATKAVQICFYCCFICFTAKARAKRP